MDLCKIDLKKASVVNAAVFLICCNDLKQPCIALSIHHLNELNGSDEGNRTALLITDDKHPDKRLCHKSGKRTTH